MSTTRRRLGTGPTTAASVTAESIALRLLPAERADPSALLERADEHQIVAERKGRRALGGGAS